jgi:hypothetical protein
VWGETGVCASGVPEPKRREVVEALLRHKDGKLCNVVLHLDFGSSSIFSGYPAHKPWITKF